VTYLDDFSSLPSMSTPYQQLVITIQVDRTVIQVHNTRGGSAAQASRAQALVVGPSTPHTPCSFSSIMKAQATANLTLSLCSYPPPSVPRTSARPQPHPRRRTGGGEEPASRLSAPPSRTALRRTPFRGAPSPPAAPLPRRPSHPGPGIPQAQGAGHTTAERRAGRPCPPGSSSSWLEPDAGGPCPPTVQLQAPLAALRAA